MKNIITVKDLKKSYGSIMAVKGIDFTVEEGSLFAFLGCNGAGKSTTIRMLCTLLAPDSGEVWIDDHSLKQAPDKIRASIGVVFQEGVLDDLLTVEENLEARACLYGYRGRALKEAVQEAIRLSGVDHYASQLYGTLSGGQKRRSDIARALVHHPKVLFLDEPTTGLDPKTRKEVWDTLVYLQKAYHMTLFLTTHYMEEAEAAHDMVIMDEGKIIAHGTPYQLKRAYTKDQLRLVCHDLEKVKAQLSYKTVQQFDRMLVVKLENTFEGLEIIERCRDWIEDFEIIKGSLDDAFIEMTGKELQR